MGLLDLLFGTKEKEAFDAAQVAPTEAELVERGCLSAKQIAHARGTGIDHAPPEVQVHHGSCSVCQQRFKEAGTD